ncbi:hypothetical protein HMN09_00438800 [Mycena chlorophos]|uniref:Uncharacterized protein n=1 Tax=Mycena chlorophos TaxID=658473 RepID=A0A8H6WJC6_MYCCL|nr:hypothetical protein HMN09_00438800 [Mycena chlorophos]
MIQAVVSIARMHHIRSRAKFRRLQHCAETAPVSGIAKSGKPGVLVFHGTNDAVATFLAGVRSLRYLDFHHVATRPFDSTQPPLSTKPGFQEVTDTKKVMEALEAIGLKDWFRSEMGLGRRKPDP